MLKAVIVHYAAELDCLHTGPRLLLWYWAHRHIIVSDSIVCDGIGQEALDPVSPSRIGTIRRFVGDRLGTYRY